MLSDIIINIKLFFCKERELYIFYRKLLGFYPSNIDYYVEALTHRSVTKKSNQGTVVNNERLEFLGDAILDAIITDILFKQFPTEKEGFLTSTRAKIVQRDNLNNVGLKLGLAEIVNFSNYSQVHNSYMCGNALEALIGAIYLDKGYRVCKKFIINNLIPENYIQEVAHTELNYKSRLIEWTQRQKVAIDFPLIGSTTDDNHSPIFTSAVTLNEIVIAQASGYSKKESHQNAAKEAYLLLEENPSLKEKIIATEVTPQP